MRADAGYRFSRNACYADRKFVAAFAKKHLSLNIVFRVQTVDGNNAAQRKSGERYMPPYKTSSLVDRWTKNRTNF